MKKRFFYIALLLFTTHLSTTSPKENGVKKVVAQNMLIDMAIMMGSQFAVEAANEWVETQDSVLYDVLTQASTNIQNDFSEFQNTISTSVSQNLTDVVSNFTSAQSDIADETTQAQADSEIESSYLTDMVSLDLPQTNYIFAPADYDSAFAKSPMYTPSGKTWYNVFAKGDWEFDPTTSSFWQYEVIDSYQLDSDTNTETLDQAPFNYVFTETFSTADSYNIDCDITLYSVSYPFFSGVMFNKNRWISGDMAGLRRCRMVGIYGKSETEIGVYYSEQYTDDSTVQTSTNVSEMTSPTQFPLDQIFDGTAQKLGDIEITDFSTISDQEVTYSFQITTTADTVSATFGKSDSTDTASTTTATITSKDSSLFLYHGIGFISPGAAAQYTLKAPTSALFSDDAIEEFKTEVDALTQAAVAA